MFTCELRTFDLFDFDKCDWRGFRSILNKIQFFNWILIDAGSLYTKLIYRWKLIIYEWPLIYLGFILKTNLHNNSIFYCRLWRQSFAIQLIQSPHINECVGQSVINHRPFWISYSIHLHIYHYEKEKLTLKYSSDSIKFKCFPYSD